MYPFTLYVRQSESPPSLPGNKALIERGGHPLPWPMENPAETLSQLLQESALVRQRQDGLPARPDQLSLLEVYATEGESVDDHP